MDWWHEFWAARRLKRYEAQAQRIAINLHSIGSMESYYAINRAFGEWERKEASRPAYARYRITSGALAERGVI